MTNGRDKVLYRAEFDERWKTYWFFQILIAFLITVIGIPLIPFWILGWGLWYTRRAFDSLHCDLGERSLMVGQGVYFRVEKTIPLDKIQDLTLREGPLLKAFGLLQLQIETAGQSGAQTASEAKLVGIKNAREFRDRVLDQRDALATGQTAPSATRTPDTEAGPGGEPAIERLIEATEANHRVLQAILQALRGPGSQ